jgi:hypothetical protein
MGLKFRRGTTAQQSGSLAFGEPYVNTTLGTLVVGGPNGDIVLGASGTGSTGNFGAISGSGLDITGNANIAGNLTLGGQLTIGDQTSDTVNVVASLSSSLIPSVTNAFDLGSEDYFWRDLYISTGSIKFVGAAGTVVGTLSNAANGMVLDSGLIANGNSSFGTSSLAITSVTGSLRITGSLRNGGEDLVATGQISHAEGLRARATGVASHAEGHNTHAHGEYSHAEGDSTSASGSSSHTEGGFTRATATAEYAHAEGYATYVEAIAGHVEGQSTVVYANARGGHAEGNHTDVYDEYGHAEGEFTMTNARGAHSEGWYSMATGQHAHAEGSRTIAQGTGSHAEGSGSWAEAHYSHASGIGTKASAVGQSVVGKFNVVDNTTSLFVIGNGTSNTNRSDLFLADADGIQISGSLTMSGSILPSVSNTFDLGSSTKFWRDLFISTGSIKFVGAAGTIVGTLTNVGNGLSLDSGIIANGNSSFGTSSLAITSVTGSLAVNGRIIATSITGAIAATNGVISGSSQLTSSLDDRYLNVGGDSVVSGSSQITLSSTTGFSAYSTSVDSRIATEKGRVDAILLAADADKDTFAEIVTLINSVDLTNDTAFASFYTASVGRLNNLESTSASVNISVSNLNTFSSSALTRLSALEVETSNLESFTSSINTTIKSKLDADGVISGSAQLTTTFDARYLNTGGDSVVSGSSQISHDSTTGYSANRHIDHTAVSISAGSGLTGGGDISATRTLSIASGGVTNDMLAGSIANAKLTNSTISGIALGSNLAALTIGTGLSGTSYNGSTGVTIANTGVTSNVAGTGVTVSGATGAVTISIGQAVATSSDVRFASIGVGMAASGTSGRIDAANDIVAFSTSDIRLKENITPIPNAIEKIRKISGNTYDWKAELKDVHGYEGNDVGVIAQEVEAVLPQLVQDRDNGYKAVKYDKLVALLIEGMKEQQLQIEQLRIDLDNCRNKGL